MIKRGVIAVVYKIKGNYAYFAVLERKSNWRGWELVKGNLESDETEEEAVIREIKEETGIKKIIKLERIDGIVKWTYRENNNFIEANYTPFMAEVDPEENINIKKDDFEHSQGYFLNYRDARAILKFKEHQELLDSAWKILKKRFR